MQRTKQNHAWRVFRLLLIFFCIGLSLQFTSCGKKQAENTVFTVDDLSGKKIGVQLGTTGDTLVSDYETDGSNTTVERFNKGNDAIQAACGVRPTLLRLPGGNHNSTVVANVGMPMIQWNVDTLDWKTRNADKTVAAVLNHVKDGDIILMHELYGATGDAVARIVPELHKRGFQMVTVSQMAAAKGRSLEAGKLYSSFH